MVIHSIAQKTLRYLTLFVLLSQPPIFPLHADQPTENWPKNNIEDLLDYIYIDKPLARASWEIYATPEPGLIPAPTDYISVVVLATPKYAPKARYHNPPGDLVAYPNLARDWLSPIHQDLAQRIMNQQSLPEEVRCYLTTYDSKKLRKRVDGFECIIESQIFIYAILVSP